MYCEYCGKENNKNNNYCVSCGKSLKSNNNINTNIQNKNQNNSLIFGIICLIMSFILNILCFIPGIISIVYAVKYKKESGKLGVGFGLSLGGMIYSLVMFIIMMFLILLFMFAYENSDEYDYNNNYEYVERV